MSQSETAVEVTRFEVKTHFEVYSIYFQGNKFEWEHERAKVWGEFPRRVIWCSAINELIKIFINSRHNGSKFKWKQQTVISKQKKKKKKI